MITRLSLAIVSLVAVRALHGQVSGILPQRGRDSLQAAEARSPTAARERQRNLDSLAAGRRRWASAKVVEYELQVHTECFCMVSVDSLPPFPLAIVRNGAVIGRSAGRPVSWLSDLTTIDSLFARVERDVRDLGRVVYKLELDSRFGFPRDYSAETAGVSDLGVRIRVDSFAVIRTGSSKANRPPN